MAKSAKSERTKSHKKLTVKKSRNLKYELKYYSDFIYETLD